MAITVPTGVNQLYGGEVLGQINAKLYEKHEAFNAGKIYVQSGFTDRFTIPVSESTYAFQAYNEDPSSFLSELKYSDVTMQLEIYQLLVKFNPKSLEKYWRPFQPTGTLNFSTLPPEVQSTMLVEIASSQQNYHADKDFNGSKANGDFYDGFITKLKSGGSDGGGSGTNGAALNRYSKARLIVESSGWTDVATKLKNMKTGIKGDAELRIAYSNPDFAWIMDALSYEVYADQQKAQTTKGVDYTQAGVKSFDGKPIIVQSQLAANTILGTYGATNTSSNLWIGQDDKGDGSGVQVD